MVPTPHSARILELLDSIRAEFDQLTQEAFVCKSQRDEFENKIAHQIKEMTKFQQSLLEMERTQQAIKKQYEEEIARLRQQLELYSNKRSQQPMIKHEQPPPNIGPASNYFGGIMNAAIAPASAAPAPPNPAQMMPTTNTMGPLEDPAYMYNNKSLDKRPTAKEFQQQQQQQQQQQITSLADLDPNSVPDNLKIEGLDWFALFNPKVKRVLKTNLIYTLEHSSVVCCVKFSLDGRLLAAGCNRVTYIYDVSNGLKICTLQDDAITQEGDLYIRSVCFSPDGRFLATGAEDKQIRIWDISTKRIRNVLLGHDQDIYSLDFSRDGRILASGSGDRTTRIWNMADGKCLHVLAVNDLNQKDPGVTSVAISYDGRLVATGSLDKMVRVWNIQSGQLMEQLEGHRDSVYSVAFMPNENELISGSLDKTIKLWRLGTNMNRGFVHSNSSTARNPCKMTFVGHKDFVLSIACTYDGKWIISGSKDRSIQFWDPKTGQPQFMLQGHKNSVISVAVATNGRPLFASGSGDNRARIWSY
ncbi:WD40 repeat-like protein [Rhizopus microsporus var. microsporus]|uniref:WD40 repeat-like protein n=1 Tax=Rhizopus microsporus var. microsporus TaxID=86635 RepID=A0A1X0QRR4_RHIZD|nr:WD40 repeat-like protein [Rhizopus microsporus var. microsporus]